MDAPTVKRKVTVAKLTPSYSATSRPLSRNSTRSPSRPASPTKSFVSTSSPLASTSTTTVRPKAKVNSSAIRRTPSSTTSDSFRPVSPAKLTRRDGALSPPSSTVSVGNRKPVVRVKASSSISSTPGPTSSSFSKAKSPSPELRARSLTASSDTLRSNPADSRKRQGSTAAVLHHASSHSNLSTPPPASIPPVPPLPPSAGGTGSVRVPRIAQSELGLPSSHYSGDAERAESSGVVAPQPIKIRSKVTTLAKNFNDAAHSTLNPELSTSPLPSPTTSTSNGGRPVTTRIRAESISFNVSFASSPGPPTSPPAPSSTQAYPITTAVPAANPHRYAPPRTSPTAHASGLRSSFSASSSPKYNDEFRPFAKTSIFPPSPSSNHTVPNGIVTNGSSYGSYGRTSGVGLSSSTSGSASSNMIVDPASVPLPPQSPPISSLSVSSRSSVVSYGGGHISYDSGTSPEGSVVSARGSNTGLKKRRDESPQSLRNSLDTLAAYASLREDDLIVNGSVDDGSTIEEDEEKNVRAEAKSNRKIADLEITNRSLLAINSSLEKTKDRQAKEIRELKRKLRETRLVLPPPAYRAVKSSLDPDEIGDDEEDVDSDISSSDDEFHSADEGLGGNNGGGKGKSDESFRRIKLMLENLIDTGKKALGKTKEDFMDAKGGAKVLTAEEVETWRDSGAGSTIGQLSDSESHLDTLDGALDDDDDDDSGRLTRSHSPTPQPATRNGSTIGLGLRNSNFKPPSASSKMLSSPKPPPILVTQSS